MKRCPTCDETYGDDERFCAVDGGLLVADLPAEEPVPLVASRHLDAPLKKTDQPLWLNLLVGLGTGVVVCAVALGVYYMMAGDRTPTINSEEPVRAETEASTTGTRPPATRPTTSPSATPSPTETPSPAETPSPVQQARQGGFSLDDLSGSPSTGNGPGTRANNPLIFRLNDGTIIRADDAWKSPEGIWYRQGTLLTLLDRDRITSVEPRTSPTPSPATGP
jgi:hypothetical protein